MLIDFNDDEIHFIRDVVANAIPQYALARINILNKIHEAEENVCCENCKNGYCRRSLQHIRKLHGDCRNHERFESIWSKEKKNDRKDRE